MKIENLIKKLNKFPKDLEVTITDGHEAVSYHGEFEFQLCEESGNKFLDIGIGGLRYTDCLPFQKNNLP